MKNAVSAPIPYARSRSRSRSRSSATLGGITALSVAAGSLSALLAAAPALADQIKTPFAEGLHVATGAVFDPAGRTWVSDTNAGFCRLTEPAGTVAGGIDTATCLGGATAIGTGPVKAGTPALADPTPLAVGSGDEIALIPDGVSRSSSVVRARWNTVTEQFDYMDRIFLSGTDSRPTAVSVGADGNAYVVFDKVDNVQRITAPASAVPSVQIVAALPLGASGVAAAKDTDGDGQIDVYVLDDTGISVFEAPTGGAIATPTPAPFAPPPPAPGTQAPPAPAAMAYDVANHALFTGTQNGLSAQDAGTDVVSRIDLATNVVEQDWALGFSMVTGFGFRNGQLLVADDPGLLEFTPPLGSGRMSLVGPAPETDFTAPVVTATPPGAYPYGTRISLTVNEAARIHFTTDGSAPTTESLRYTSPITLTGNMTVRFLAQDLAGNTSAVGSAAYVRATVTPSVQMRDFNTDGKADVLVRHVNGSVYLFTGNGNGSFGMRPFVGSGWSGMTALVAPGDMNGDRRADLIARDSSGRLWLYKGSGRGTFFSNRQLIGIGWSGMSAIVGTGDFNGDGKVDVLGRDARGASWLYPGVGNGTLNKRIYLGWALKGMTAVTAAGDLNRDGHADIVARDANGRLLLFRGTGAARLMPAFVISPSGWNTRNAILGTGDLNGDGIGDLITRDYSGRVIFHAGNGQARFKAAVLVGSGWGGYRFIL